MALALSAIWVCGRLSCVWKPAIFGGCPPSVKLTWSFSQFGSFRCTFLFSGSRRLLSNSPVAPPAAFCGSELTVTAEDAVAAAFAAAAGLRVLLPQGLRIMESGPQQLQVEAFLGSRHWCPGFGAYACKLRSQSDLRRASKGQGESAAGI